MQTTSTPSGTPCCTTPGQCVPMSAIQAEHNRYTCSMLMAVAYGNEEYYHYFRGMARATEDMIKHASGSIYAANRDASMGGYQPLGGFESAWSAWMALSIGFENSSLADVKQILTAHGAKWPSDDVADSELDAVAQLKGNEVAAVNADDEIAALTADLNDGALLHGAPCVVSSIVAQGGAA